MSTDRFFDDLARALASPMPRRRAVRVIGASLVAIAVPGVSPPRARAFSDECETRSGQLGSFSCSRFDRATGKVECKYCGYPFQRYQCVDNTCVDGCETVAKATGKPQRPTWSAKTDPNGRPLRFQCCPVPDTIPRDGECLPNCKALNGRGWKQCGNACCPPGQRCRGGRCTTQCSSQREMCGRDSCCLKDEQCCVAGICCAKTEDCCGYACCGKGQFCCDGGGGAGTCCREDEYCLHQLKAGTRPRDVVGLPHNARCQPACNPINRCGDSCCGRGFICKRGRCQLNV
jgi:hypothetical protein